MGLSSDQYKTVSFVTLSIILLLIFSLPVFSQLNYSGFPSSASNSLTLVGDAQINSDVLRLITAQNMGSRAAVWSNTTHRVTDGFVTMFTFRITNATGPDNGGADGFAFVIHSWGTGAIGNSGGQIGYASDIDGDPLGIPYSLAFEFDTYRNTVLNDPDNNHLSIHNAGQFYNDANENASLGRTSAIPFLRDGNIHTVRIEYDGASNNHQMRVYMDDLVTPKLTRNINLSTILLDNGPEAYIGFTGASAFEWETHEILSWSFSPKFPSNLPGFTAPDADSLGPQPVSTPDYHPGGDANDFNPNGMIDTSVIPDRRTELWAKYYFPSNLSAGPYPLVVLLHGNHLTCGTGTNPRRDDEGDYTDSGTCPSGYVVTPNHKGYDYLAEKLSSWGYIVVSINANLGINAGVGYPKIDFSDVSKFPEYSDDRLLILTRGRLVLKHLQRLSEWNAGVSPFITGTRLGTGRTRIPAYRGWYGMKITTGSQPIKIRSLGRVYYKGNNQTHRLRVVRVSDNATVAETQVTMTDMTHGQFKYVDLASPVTLAANTSYYVASEEWTGGDKFFDTDTVVQATPNATIDGAIMSINNGGSWKNPALSIQPYGTVNFIYEADSTTPSQLGVNLKGKIDFNNVGLMGHSRGGEGMRAAYELYREPNSPWTARILAPMMKIKGIFEFAPTDRFVVDRNFQLLRLMNADGAAWNVILPACDGDVSFLSGVKPFDRMLSITGESPAMPKSVYYVYGANHNFYNTQWQESDSFKSIVSPVDPNGCIGPDNNPLFLNPTVTGTGYGSLNQQKTGLSPFLAFMRANIGSSVTANFNQNFDPRFKVPSSVSSITKIERSHTPSPSTSQTLVLNDINLPVSTNICTNSLFVCSPTDLQAVSSKVQVRSDPPYSGQMNHDEDFNAANISWNSPNPNRYFQANYNGTSVNVSAFETLDFRISRRRDNTNPLIADPLNNTDITNLSVQLIMADGTISSAAGLLKYVQLVGPVGKTHQTFPPPDGTLTFGELHPILRTIKIPLSDFSGLDLTQIKGVRFIFNDTRTGAINLSNVRFSK